MKVNDLRFHRKKFPVPGELVVGKIVKITTDIGVYVNLLEYGNLEGLIVIGELSRKKIRNIHRLIKVNKIEVLSVLRVNEEKGYIDLSRRKVIEADFNETYRLYTKNKIAHNIIVSLASRLNVEPIELYKNWGWDKEEKYNSLYDFFGLLLNTHNKKQGKEIDEIIEKESESSNEEEKINKNEETEIQNENIKNEKYLNTNKHAEILDNLLEGIPQNIHNLLLEQIVIKYNIQKVKIRADINMTSRGSQGILTIKNSVSKALAEINDQIKKESDKILNHEKKTDDEENEIEVTLFKPPTYSVILCTENLQKGKENIRKCINLIKKYLLEHKGTSFEESSFKVFGLKERRLDEDESEEKEEAS